MRIIHLRTGAVGLAATAAFVVGTATAVATPNASATLVVGPTRAVAARSVSAPPYTVHYYQRNTGLKQTPTVIEFTDVDYVGTYARHDKTWSASDHFLCTFPSSSSDTPTCDGELAIGSSILLISGIGGQGTFSIPITGGSGNYLGAVGTVRVQDIGQGPDANLTVTITRT